MNLIITRIFQTTVFFFVCSFLIANNPGKDFLITLNGSKLTGSIKDIAFQNGQFRISFENDFGDIYTVSPATIYGFAYDEEGEVFIYESKFLNGEWRFLKVEKRGQALSLYTSSERQLQFINTNESPILVEEKNPQIWLQFKGEQPFKLYRLTYRRVLKKKMAAYPDLAKSIGKRGSRYKNLSKIVELYNRLEAERD